MATHKKTEKQFLLKDLLFNFAKVTRLAAEIKAVYPDFDSTGFTKKVVTAFPKQELMERLGGIREGLEIFLPSEYPKALAVILAALPPELDTKNTDDDFGEFIYAPYSYFVAKNGCTKKYLSVSLKALEEITKRFSAEAALRDFLNAFPDETLATAQKWAAHKNYHVRRLASEGTRPNLPWAKKVTIQPKSTLLILDLLHADTTRYVTRSVANHLNDLSKNNTALVVATLKRWQKEGRQTERELGYITKHALRTAVKRGDAAALQLLGFSVPQVAVSELRLERTKVKVGEAVAFSFSLTSTTSKVQTLLIDYLVHFKKANGTHSPKVFKLTNKKIAPGETIVFAKVHNLKPMTTRTLYSGAHLLEVQVNGQSFGTATFELG